VTQCKLVRLDIVLKKKMNEILNQYTDDEKPSEELKSRILESARLFILARDLGELFTLGLGRSDKKKDQDDETN
jgi:hypothetical protein